MAKVNVFHDPIGNTLVVWFGELEMASLTKSSTLSITILSTVGA